MRLLPGDSFRFSTPIKVRFRDLDALGHVNNAVYFTYMEQARVDYMDRLGLFQPDQSKVGFIIAEATCQYKAPIRRDSLLTVKVRVSHIGNSSFIMDYHLVDQPSGELMAVGRTVNVVYDYAAGRSVPMPADWRARLTAFEGM